MGNNLKQAKYTVKAAFTTSTAPNSYCTIQLFMRFKFLVLVFYFFPTLLL